LFRGSITRGLIYGCCLARGEFGWHVDVLGYGAGNGCPDRWRSSVCFASGSFGNDACWCGERAGWCRSVLWVAGCERGVRRVERDGGACPCRLGTGDGIVCGCGAAVGGARKALMAVLAICWTMAVCAAMQPFYLSRCENPGAGRGSSMPGDRGSGVHSNWLRSRWGDWDRSLLVRRGPAALI